MVHYISVGKYTALLSWAYEVFWYESEGVILSKVSRRATWYMSELCEAPVWF